MVTKFGVSVENVVATIEKPKSHHGILLPDKKKSPEDFPACFETIKPIAIAKTKNAIRMPKSMPAYSLTANKFMLLFIFGVMLI